MEELREGRGRNVWRREEGRSDGGIREGEGKRMDVWMLAGWWMDTGWMMAG